MCQPPPYPPLQRKIDHWQYCQCCYPQLTPMTSLSVRNFMEFMEILSGATGCIFCFVWRVYCDIPAGISNGFSKYACDWHPHTFYNFSSGDSLVIYIWHAPAQSISLHWHGRVSIPLLYLMFLRLTYNIMGEKIGKRKEKVIIQKDPWWSHIYTNLSNERVNELFCEWNGKILSKSEWKLNENNLVAILAFQMLKVLWQIS